MSIKALTTGLQTVTATGAVTPIAGLDISGMTKDATICVEVIGLTAGAAARIQIEDSVNGFTALNAVAVADVVGPIGSGVAFVAGALVPNTVKFTWREYQLASNNFGVASAVARVNLTVLTGTTPSISMNAWIEA